MPKDVEYLYNYHKDKQSRPSLGEISNVLQSVIADYLKCFIVIDALEECLDSDGGRKKLLSEMLNLQAKTGANIFATSRFIPEITNEFEGSI